MHNLLCVAQPMSCRYATSVLDMGTTHFVTVGVRDAAAAA